MSTLYCLSSLATMAVLRGIVRLCVLAESSNVLMFQVAICSRFCCELLPGYEVSHGSGSPFRINGMSFV